ncbi:hypothetical protein RJT34_06588 [Clitoria ternatea]|uniref:Uncharacterized protein n=1 Tax=Clitoria ternatea TaxID=43366 RepID=A0AAN9K1W1_CLITE
MADSSISFLLEKLTCLLQEEVNLQRGVREDVQYIKDELERHKAILKVADAVEDRDPELKAWVKRVRDIALDMEDAIDEFNLRLVDQQGQNLFGLKTLKARHRIASEIQGIKSKVEIISQGRPNLSGIGSSSSQRLSKRLDSQDDALLLEEADLVGIDKPKKQLGDLLFNEEPGRAVIPICGMGGLGKTTLAKQVYDDPKVKKRFRIHAWVNVSQSFKLEELLKDLVQQLHNVIGKPAPEAVGQMKSDKLKEVIKNLLQQSRYLIVLDDVWHVRVWDSVKLALPNNNRGSRVMLTTRKKDIALHSCAELGKDFNLEFLPEEEAWSLFCRKTFQGNSCPYHLEEVCRKILKMCGGLPLAIVAIGGALATRSRANIEEWQMVCKSFGSEIEGNDKLEDMKKVLFLSFNELPYYLKSCLLYLSIFPEFHAIEHMRLVRLWISEGFVNGEDGKTLEEVADSYLKELLNRSLLQVVAKTSDGRMKTCRMHDLIREVINLKTKDQNFATIAKEHDINWPDKVRRLSIMNTLNNVVRQNRITFQLRSLLMFSLSDSLEHFSINALCPNGFKLLRVLDVQDAPLEVFPAEIVNLYLLKYLSLKNTKVKNIPGSIKKLQQLETLDLKHSHVTELPVEIVELQRLRHLLVYRYEIESYAYFHSRHGFKVAAPIGNMQSLQKLCFIEADKGSKELMIELGKLTQLRRLGIRKMRREDGAALCSSIEKMVNLRSLSITAIDEDEIIDLHNISKPPPYLQQLYLSGRLEKFPQWISSLKNLVRVFLKWSRLKEDPLVHLQDLPNLRHLEFLQVYVGERLHFKGGFPSLKVLGLDDLGGVKSMIVEEGAMPGLKKLIIQRCDSFKHVPIGIEHLTKLKTIEFFDMPEEFITTLHPNSGEEYWRVQHVPVVYSTYWRDGGWDVYSLETLGERESDSSRGTAMRSLEVRTLWKLETLDLKHSHVTELPVEIVELQRLRHLLVYRHEIESYAYFHSRQGFKVAAPIGNMQSLQKLCFIESDKGSKELMIELGKLTQLRRLGIRKMRREDGAALCSSIEKMVNLRSLSITAIDVDEIIDLHNISKPPPYLQQLYLSGCWISSLKNLVRVFLKWSRLKEDPLVHLQDLPNLRHLEFLQIYVGERLHFKDGFASLKVLGLDDLGGVKSMIVEEGAMPGLKKLISQRCDSFKHVPIGIEHLTKLKTIEFFDMPEEFIATLHPNSGEEYWRVQHVPVVYSTYWRDTFIK